MGVSFWVRLAITTVIGILALLNTAAARSGPRETIAFLIFLAAIVYGFYLIKQRYDRIDSAHH